MKPTTEENLRQVEKDLSDTIKGITEKNPMYQALTNKAVLDELADIIEEGIKKLKQANVPLPTEESVQTSLPPRTKEPIFNQPLGARPH